MRVSADAPGRITVSTWIDRPQDATTHVAGNDRLNLVGALAGGKGMSFLASVKISMTADGRGYPERILGTDERRHAHRDAATSYRGTRSRVGERRWRGEATAVRKTEIGYIADHQNFSAVSRGTRKASHAPLPRRALAVKRVDRSRP